jgi:flagellar export protein FliJ
MAKFTFRFETVLKQRKQEETSTMTKLATAQRALLAEKEKKERLQRALADALWRREELGTASVTISAYHLEESFIVGTKQRIIQQEQGIMRASRGVEKALRAFLIARRRTEVVTRLREKDLAEFKKAVTKREQKQMDDLTVMRSRIEPVTGQRPGSVERSGEQYVERSGEQYVERSGEQYVERSREQYDEEETA